MSNLLKEAIVDAKALREAALKSAESEIINKYSSQVRDTMEKLLEQEEGELGDLGGGDETEGAAPELDLGGDLGADAGDPMADAAGAETPAGEEIVDNIPLAATDNFSSLSGNGLSEAPQEGEEVEFNVNLDALQEVVGQLQEQLDTQTEYEFDENTLRNILNEDDQEGASDLYDVDEDSDDDDEKDSEGSSSAGALAASAAATKATDSTQRGSFEEGIVTDELIDAIAEELTVDMGAQLSGWAGSPDFKQDYQTKKELAHRRSTDVQKDLEITKDAYEELVFENKKLADHLSQYKQTIEELKEGLQDVNLSNARLLYSNRVLRNASLNERQKNKIVEAISGAGSVTEARTIFDTLQSTVVSTPKRGPQSLSEAITRRSSVIRASRTEKPSADPFQDRMKRLAGIK
tara:strand:- start:1307 stop:2524 length:1218 start_codon:yes stop_codon:yes gene_type:complete